MSTKFKYSVTNDGNPIDVIDSEGHIVQRAVYGNTFYVDYANGLDSNTGLSAEKAFKTLSAAYAACTSNNNDVIYVNGYSGVAETAMITWSKSRITVIGVGGGYKYGLGARITMGVTEAITDVFLLKVTGIRNRFVNLKFDSGNTLTQAVATVGEGGEYTVYQNCEFYNSAKLTSDTHAEMVLNGDSAQFIGCTFGSLATAVSGDKIRPAILLTKATVAAGKVSRDVLFTGCNFWKKAGGTATAMIKGAATDIERLMEFEDCKFIANPLGSAPAVAINVANLTVGMIILTGSTIAVGCTKVGTATGIFNGTPERVATATIGIQAT